MTNLLTIFPDSKNLLALEPEELGGIILEIAYGLAGKFTFMTLLEPLFPHTGQGYPQNARHSVIHAVAEAINWLVSASLLIKDPQQPGDWYIPTRRANSLKTRVDVEAYRKGRVLPVELLQPVLVEKVWPLFMRGDQDIAVFQAFKEVEVAVRKAANSKGANYPDDLVGVSLMNKAFHIETGPLTDRERVSAERQAEMFLFSGAVAHAKNPTSHRDVNIPPAEAARLIVFASHLLDIVEKRLLLTIGLKKVSSYWQ